MDGWMVTLYSSFGEMSEGSEGEVRLTGLRPEGCGRLMAAGYVRFAQGATAPTALKVADCRSAAMLIKSALRDWLSMSYGMISILRIGSLRAPPPIRLRRTSPCSGGRIGRSMLSCRDMVAPWLSIHSAPACGGKVVAPATKGGNAGVVHEAYDSPVFLLISLVFPCGEMPRSGKRVYEVKHRFDTLSFS